MDEVFTLEDIKKALEQADANIEFEEVDLTSIINKDEQKVLRKDLTSERKNR